jgi:hypothetical protein
MTEEKTTVGSRTALEAENCVRLGTTSLPTRTFFRSGDTLTLA